MKMKLQNALKEAMRARDQVRLDTIRSVLSAIDYEELQKGSEVTEGAFIEIVKREIKKRKEELEFAEKAQRSEEIAKLGSESKILEGFLPQQLSAADIEKIIVELKEANPATNMGLVMKTLKEKYAGQYDSKVASEIAKRVAG